MLRVVDLSRAPDAGPETGTASPPGVILAYGAAADLARCRIMAGDSDFHADRGPR